MNRIFSYFFSILFALFIFPHFSTLSAEESGVSVKSKYKKEQMGKYFNAATMFYKQGRYKEAIEAWERVLIMDPGHALSKKKIEKARSKLIDQDDILIFDDDIIIIEDETVIEEEDSVISSDDNALISEEMEMEEMIETMEEDSSSVDIIENLQNYAVDALNINEASEEELRQLPGLTDHDAFSIYSYRKNNKKFKRIRDLLKVSGITEEKFTRISPYVQVTQRVRPKLKGDYRLLWDDNFADAETPFLSTPKIYSRLRLGYGDIRAGFLTEQDRGEKSLTNCLKYFVGVRNLNVIKAMYLGNYRVGFGQGVVFDNMGGSSPRIFDREREPSGDVYAEQIFPGADSRNGVFEEYQLRGFLINPQLGSVDATLFLSDDKKNAALNDDGTISYLTDLPELPEGWRWTSFGEDKTVKRDIIQERLSGANLGFSPFFGTRFGVTGYKSVYSEDLNPLSLSDDAAIRGSQLPNLVNGKERLVYGTDFETQLDNVLFQGEFGQVDEMGKAYNISVSAELGKLRLRALHRHYDTNFDNPYGNRAFADSDSIYGYQSRDEVGSCFELKYRFNQKFEIERFLYDQWQHPSDLTIDNRILLQLKFQLAHNLRLRVRPRWRTQDINGHSEKVKFDPWVKLYYYPSRGKKITVKYMYRYDTRSTWEKVATGDCIEGEYYHKIGGNNQLIVKVRFWDFAKHDPYVVNYTYSSQMGYPLEAIDGVGQRFDIFYSFKMKENVNFTIHYKNQMVLTYEAEDENALKLQLDISL